MEKDLFVQEGIVIPVHEIEITASKSGGPGGQHTNKTNTKITVRWNVKNSKVLDDIQKEHILQNLHTHITTEGDLIVHESETRSQHQNREIALKHLAQMIRDALYIPKERIVTHIPRSIKEERLKTKSHKSEVKKMRAKKIKDFNGD